MVKTQCGALMVDDGGLISGANWNSIIPTCSGEFQIIQINRNRYQKLVQTKFPRGSLGVVRL